MLKTYEVRNLTFMMLSVNYESRADGIQIKNFISTRSRDRGLIYYLSCQWMGCVMVNLTWGSVLPTSSPLHDEYGIVVVS